MHKKRGVVVSITQNSQAMSKRKSAQVNPLNTDVYKHSLNNFGPQDATRSLGLQVMDNVELSESNLLGSQPQFLINQAHYNNPNPDYSGSHDHNNFEENDDSFIESMHKKKEKQEQNRKNQEKQRKKETSAKSTGPGYKEKRLQKSKQTQKNKFDKVCKMGSSPQNVKNKINKEKELNHRCQRAQKTQGQAKNSQNSNFKKQLKSERFKPRPLHFDSDILQKLPMQPTHRRKTETSINLKKLIIPKNTQQMRGVENQQSEQQFKIGQNRNCRKMPFRFQDAM